MAEPNKNGIDKSAPTSGDYSKVRSPMKPYRVKGGGGKKR